MKNSIAASAIFIIYMTLVSGCATVSVPVKQEKSVENSTAAKDQAVNLPKDDSRADIGADGQKPIYKSEYEGSEKDAQGNIIRHKKEQGSLDEISADKDMDITIGFSEEIVLNKFWLKSVVDTGKDGGKKSVEVVIPGERLVLSGNEEYPSLLTVHVKAWELKKLKENANSNKIRFFSMYIDAVGKYDGLPLDKDAGTVPVNGSDEGYEKDGPLRF